MFDWNESDEPRMIYPAPDRQALENDPAAFGARLEAITPSAFVTPLLIALNAIVFVLTIVGGADFFSPTAKSLIDWGANFGPNTISDGQWWRLVSSMFLHIGIIHIAFNMYVLAKGGPFIERLFGNAGYLIVYLVSGLGGGLLSMAIHPYTVSAGASGAIFGLYGALVGQLVSQHELIPEEVQSRLTKTALVFIGYNLVFGIMQSGIDLADHIGGLVTGFVCGLVMAVPVTLDRPAARTLRNCGVLAVAGILFAGVALRLPHPVDFVAELSSFAAMEKKALASYNAALAEARGAKMKDDVLADRIENEVLRDWGTEYGKMAALKGLPSAAQTSVTNTLAYMDARQQGWSMMVSGLRAHDVSTVRAGAAKENEANVLAAQLTSKSTNLRP